MTAAPLKYVGAALPRVDAHDKVTGRTAYTADLSLPGMATGAFVGSPYPHARILHVETSAAERVPGVYAVLTQDDLLGDDVDPYYGPILRDQPILAIGKTRFVGEPVVAVAAVSEEIAQEAAALVAVTFEEIPAALDPHAAMAPGAPRVHEVLESTAAFADVQGITFDPSRNICNHTETRQGDPEAAFAECALVLEQTYRTPAIQGLPLEPHSCLAQVQPSGDIAVWSTTQTPFFLRSELARVFHLPMSRVRVMVPPLGGGFGSKGYLKIEPLTVALARKARVPVKITLSGRQVFTNTHTRHASEVRLKMGVNATGRILAATMNILLDTGAYADTGPRVSKKAAYIGLGPYCIPHFAIASTSVFTNKLAAGAFRGYGLPQTAWALESHVDALAHRLGMDPLAFRLRNLVAEGGFYNQVEEVVESTRLSLLAAADAVGWMPGAGPRRDGTQDGEAHRARGWGIACTAKSTITPTLSQASIKLYEDGTATVESGTVEMGQGSGTVLTQIAAEALQIDPSRVRLAPIDTDHTPYDQVTGSSRSTYSMGLAISAAAGDIKEQLKRIGSRLFEVDPADVEYRDGEVSVVGSPNKCAAIPQALRFHFGMRGGALVGQGELQTRATFAEDLARHPATSAFWGSAATVAEVAVDRETGEVRVLRCVTATDAGKTINPRSASGQLEGAMMQALGHTLQEELLWDEGQPVNFSLTDYALPLFDQLPDMQAILVERPDPTGPFGARGIGEVCIPVTSPAVANAVFDALGTRVIQLPLSGERVWEGNRAEQTEATRS